VFVPAPRAYGKDGYSEEMEQLLESMEAANISPSRKVFMEVVDMYGLSTNVIKSVTKQSIHKKPELGADANSILVR
jgi:pentatricopeptide repeat protein